MAGGESKALNAALEAEVWAEVCVGAIPVLARWAIGVYDKVVRTCSG